MKRRFLSFVIGVCMVASFAGCDKTADTNNKENTNSAETNNEQSEEVVKLEDVSQMEKFSVSYTDTDEIPNWEKSNTKIELKDTDVVIEGKGASFKNKTISITKSGFYVLSGKLSDGKIVIDADKKEKVYLVLNGAEINCNDDAVINETQADKVIITLVEGTENTLTDGKVHADENITAAVYCKDSLTINGAGKLTVNGNNKDAITSKDKLKIIGSNISVVAADDGLVGKDLVAVKSVTVNIESSGDGIKSSETTDIEKGIICIDGGNINVNSVLDAIQAENFVRINGGSLKLITGGSSANDSTSQEDDILEGTPVSDGGFSTGEVPESMPKPDGEFPTGEMPEGMPMPDGEFPTGEISEGMPKPDREIPTNENGEIKGRENGFGGNRGPGGGKNKGDWGNWGENSEEASKEETPSAKAIKGGNGVYITEGSINIDSSDDAIHANDMVYILGGTIDISSGDDGIHGDTTLDISGGKIDIVKSYEGLEAYSINISGGEISLVASDDGLNAAGGVDGSSVNGRVGQNKFSMGDTGAGITISGGNIQLTAYGDGIDSNGSITMTDGTLIVCGPENGGNGIIDYAGEFIMDGGVLLGAGTSSMFMSVGENSQQNVINATLSGSSKDLITVLDGDEKLIEFTANTRYTALIISTPQLEEGKSYTIRYGDKETNSVAEKGEYYRGM